MRGVPGNNKLVILVNGMRVNPPGGENIPLRSDFSVRNAEQIEVIYGSGSTLYGGDAVSAVINIITRKPSDHAGLEARMAPLMTSSVKAAPLCTIRPTEVVPIRYRGFGMRLMRPMVDILKASGRS